MLFCSLTNTFTGRRDILRDSDFAALAQSSLFYGMDTALIKKIVEAEKIDVADYRKHEVILSPRSPVTSLAVITKGKADVYKSTDKGDLFLSILAPGSVFGMAGLFYGNGVFINTVKAREDCKIAFIAKDSLERIFAAYPAVVTNYITVLSQKIHYLNQKIGNLTSPLPSARLMAYLRSLEKDGTGTVTLPVSISELSRVLSLGRTSLYAAFDELTENGLIERTGKQIRILNPKGNE